MTQSMPWPKWLVLVGEALVAGNWELRDIEAYLQEKYKASPPRKDIAKLRTMIDGVNEPLKFHAFCKYLAGKKARY